MLVVDREMQVAAVVMWVSVKQCGTAVDALKRVTGALIRGHPQAASGHNDHVHGRSCGEIRFDH